MVTTKKGVRTSERISRAIVCSGTQARFHHISSAMKQNLEQTNEVARSCACGKQPKIMIKTSGISRRRSRQRELVSPLVQPLSVHRLTHLSRLRMLSHGHGEDVGGERKKKKIDSWQAQPCGQATCRPPACHTYKGNPTIPHAWGFTLACFPSLRGLDFSHGWWVVSGLVLIVLI